VLIFFAVFGIFYLLPDINFDGGLAAVLRLVLSALAFLAIMFWEVRRIRNADLPEVRAAESLATAVPLFLTIFATTYYSLSITSPGDFSEHLDRTTALYFAIVTFGTVGFGDITPTIDLTRVIVSSQILGDLILIGLLLRLLVKVSQTTIQRAQHSAKGEDAEPSA
jgi:voltage-gated potassium channel